MEKAKEWLTNPKGKGRFVRFCITGGLNTLVDFAIYTLLTTQWNMGLYLSQGISYFAGMLNSYCINRRWTFQTRERFFSREMLRFGVVNLVVLCLSLVVMWYCNEQLGWYYLFSKVITIGFTMVLGFVLNRLVVFRSSKQVD